MKTNIAIIIFALICWLTPLLDIVLGLAFIGFIIVAIVSFIRNLLR